MNLKREISRSLYQAIQEKYERGLYRDAVLSAITFLEECVRRKTQIERLKMGADPIACFQEAFSGAEPLIRINAMTTVAEILEQQEFPQLLNGLYRGIRHPRFHADESFDDEKTANAILVFIDYLLHQIQSGTASPVPIVQTSPVSGGTMQRMHDAQRETGDLGC